MTMKARMHWLDWIMVASGALLLNLAVFGAASLLQRELSDGHSIIAQSINLFIPEEAPSVPKNKLTPPPKKEPPRMEPRRLKLDTASKEIPDIPAPALTFDINTKLSTGLNLGSSMRDGYGMAELNQRPVVISRAPTLYPYHAKRQGIEGVVSVRFLVDKEGKVSRLSVTRAKPPNVFESAVLRSVARWRFRPGYKDGEPVDTWVETEIEFTLEKQ